MDLLIALDTEECLLASLLYDWPDNHWDDAELLSLRPKHFQRDKNRWIFAAITDLRERGISPEFNIVAQELATKDPKAYKAIGGRDYFRMLAEVMRDHAMSFLHIRAWAHQIKVNYAINKGEPIIERRKRIRATADGVEI